MSLTKTKKKILLCALIFCSVAVVHVAYGAGSQTYSSPGTYSFIVPLYGTLTVSVWGGGAAGDTNGGAASSFSGIVAYGGQTSNANTGTGGAGGGASGGTTNMTGGSGTAGTVSCGGSGGSSPNGGSGGVGPCGSTLSIDGNSGAAPGGGGSGMYSCTKGCYGGSGGGGGGYASRVYAQGDLGVGSNVTVTVGSGGSPDLTYYGSFPISGYGAPGRVSISWTDPPLPPAPGTPTFSSVTASSMRVSWTSASGATSYKIERCTGAGCTGFAQIASGVTNTYYDDSGLTAGTTYMYRVRGTNVGGDGVYSNSAGGSTLPPAPGTPTFSSVTASSMRVSWTSASGATSYKIERCTGAGCTGFAQIASGVTNTYYDDSGLSFLTTYQYRVRGTNSGGDGAYSGTGSQSTTCSFNGQSVPLGSSVTAYQAPTVPYNQSCVSEQRTCTGGGLSGTYAYSSCSVNPPPPPNALGGYAWSDTIGWISLNCATGGATGGNICSTRDYHVDIDGSGYLVGYAWSDSIGWVKFGGLSSFPSGAGTYSQNAQIVGNELRGWMRACAGTSSGDCSSMTSRSDGWDGWMSLRGSGYGISISGGIFVPCQSGTTSCAWGDVNVGWIDFSGASAGFEACGSTQGNFCDPSGASGVSKHRDANCAITINPPNPCAWQCEPVSGLCISPPAPTGALNGALFVRPNGTSSVSWVVQNAQSCTATGSDGTVVSTSGTVITLGGETTYTLVCTDSIGTPYTVDTMTIRVLPEWQEL